ncbi:hypothetical protein GXW82_09005 [Streptacidiphilus sp. 4-A2]|nr:hypothetical protein [Streptacidiphilus sp. 4-A2]
MTGSAAESTASAGRVDTADLRARHTQRRARATGRKKPQRLFSLGPRWNNVVTIDSVPGDRAEHLVSLALPEVFADETGGHALHPALLDSATSHARDPERDSFHLPFMYRSLTLHVASLPPRLLSHIRRQDSADGLIVADVTLLSEDGQLLAAIEGFTMRRVEDGTFVEAAAAPSAPASTAPSAPADGPAPGPAGVPLDGALAVQSGIDPGTGARLLLDLLDSVTPARSRSRPSVTARRYRSPHPAVRLCGPSRRWPPPRPRPPSRRPRHLSRRPRLRPGQPPRPRPRPRRSRRPAPIRWRNGSGSCGPPRSAWSRSAPTTTSSTSAATRSPRSS